MSAVHKTHIFLLLQDLLIKRVLEEVTENLDDAFFRDSDFIETEVEDDPERFLWSKDGYILGRVLNAHLVLEHYMTRYLKRLSPNKTSKSIDSLTFHKKILRLPDSDVFLRWLKPSIKEVNDIRNQFAHRLDTTLSTRDLDSITKALQKAGINSSKSTGLVQELVRSRPGRQTRFFSSSKNDIGVSVEAVRDIEHFVVVACGFFKR